MLKKIFEKLANTIIVVGIITAVGLGLISMFNARDTKTQLALLNDSMQRTEQRVKIIQEENKAWEKENEGLKEDITELRKEAKANSLEIKKGVEYSKKLTADRPPILEECREIVGYIQKEIDAYVANFSLAIRDRDTWIQVSDKWNLAYDNQVKISINLTSAMSLIVSDSLKKDEAIKSLNKNLKLSRAKNYLIGGGMVAIVIVAVIWGMFK